MSNVVCLTKYKEEKNGYERYYLENYDLIPEYIHTFENNQKESKKETERQMQLQYMKMLTRSIENN